jgi:DNA-directed RNA polymerase specialized sigma24 family protein
MTPVKKIDDDELVLTLVPDQALSVESMHEARQFAIEEIKRRHWDKVWDVAYEEFTRYLGVDASCRVNLDGFTENVFLWLVNIGAAKYREYKAKRDPKGPFAGWLYKTAARKVIDHLRREKVHPVPLESSHGDDEPNLLDTLPAPGPSPEEEILAPSTREEELGRRIEELLRVSKFLSAIRQCMAELRQKNRDHHLAAVLAWGAHLSDEEIASISSVLPGKSDPVSKQAAANWKNRALSFVEACLANKGFTIERGQDSKWTSSFRETIVMTISDAMVIHLKDKGANDNE